MTRVLIVEDEVSFSDAAFFHASQGKGSTWPLPRTAIRQDLRAAGR